jgi:hypothetical protein
MATSIDSSFLSAEDQHLSASQFSRDLNVSDRDQKDRYRYPDEKHVEHSFRPQEQDSIKHALAFSLRMLIFLSGDD